MIRKLAGRACRECIDTLVKRVWMECEFNPSLHSAALPATMFWPDIKIENERVHLFESRLLFSITPNTYGFHILLTIQLKIVCKQ